MLYDPKWNKEFSLVGLIGWLETKDPDARYNWQTCWGACLIGEWRRAVDGVRLGEAETWVMTAEIGRLMGTSPEHTAIAMVAACGPWTYGTALNRARRALACQQAA